jgi:predicted GNAT family acetyltransferase
MILERGNENVIIYHLVKKIRRGSYLRERTRLLGARLTRKSLEELKKREKASGNQPYCAFVDKKIVSITHLAPVVNGVWLIGWTFTKREYRNRGFATSVVSYAVRDVIERRNAKRIVLFVIRENFPAKRVYEKVGFRRYKEMVWFDLNTGLLRVENDA